MGTSMKTLTVHLPLWDWHGRVVIGGTFAQFSAWAKKKFSVEFATDEGADPAGFAYVLEGYPWLLWVDSPNNLPALAHEAFHVTSFVLKNRGLKHTMASEEAYAYTLGFILKQIVEAKRWRTIRG